LLLCLKPHVLRATRVNLQEREPEFTGPRARAVSGSTRRTVGTITHRLPRAGGQRIAGISTNSGGGA
jgi:hypothetical protein